MESLKKKALDASSTSGMFVIDVNTISHDNLGYWILVVTHTYVLICRA